MKIFYWKKVLLKPLGGGGGGGEGEDTMYTDYFVMIVHDLSLPIEK